MFDRTHKKTPDDLRSARWFAPDDLRSFGHRSRVMQMGYGAADYMGKPIIGILNTWSDLNPCHVHFKQRVEDVKRGVLEAGGFPVEMPAITLSESFMKPTTMLYRNLLAIETEEQIRAHPVDGVVLMGGCDKTTPGLIMGALSAGLPMIYLPAGPMLRGNYAGQTARLGLRRLEVLGRAPRRQHQREAVARRRGRHRALLRPLHDHGHRLDDDGDRRLDGPDAARRLLDPGARRQPHPHVLGMRPPHRRDGLGGPDPRPRSSPRPRCATPRPSPWRPAARPTPSSTCSPWRAAAGCR